MRFVTDGSVSDVSLALHKLLLDIKLHASPSVYVDPDAFRRTHCYSESVTRLLASHKASLRTIFEGVSAGDGGGGKGAKLLSLEEWEVPSLGGLNCVFPYSHPIPSLAHMSCRPSMVRNG